MITQPLYRFEGYFWSDAGDDSCWMAIMGGSDWSRAELEMMDPAKNSAEQMAEVAKAIAALPDDMKPPKRGEPRRKMIPADGQLDD